MSDRVFADTNLLVYARDAGHPGKQEVAADWLRVLWETRRGCLSMQVLQEYYVVVTAKLKPGLPVAQAREDVRNLSLWEPVISDISLLESAWRYADRYGFSWWDAQIIAAAKRADCSLLLSEDMQHGLALDGMQIVNPFAADAVSSSVIKR
jgi:predicted nucleic acid-binding protein